MVDYITIHSRKVWFTMADWQALGDLLAERYPQARYFVYPDWPRGEAIPKPDISFHKHLMGLTPKSPLGIMMVFDPEWQPVIEKRWYNKETEPDDWWWGLSATAKPNVLFRITTSWDPSDFPHFEEEIDFYVDRREEEQLALRSQFFRLITKVSSNRDLAFYKLPERSLIRIEKAGSYCRIGLDARRRLKENPDLFCYPALGKDVGVRPVEAD